MPAPQPLHITVAGRDVCGLRLLGAPEVGLPVALVHGLACSSVMFEPLLAELATRTFSRETLALDMPGFGRTDAPPRPLDIDALARWYLAALADLGHARVHVLGHSMGGQVALAMARLAPGRVASATLLGPTSGAEGTRPIRYALGLIADAVFESYAYNRALLTTWRQMGPIRFFRTLPGMLRDRPLSRAAQVRCPVLVVRGDRDRIVPERSIRRLAAALPRGRWTTIRRVAHAVQFDRPDALLAVLLPFLAEAESAPRATIYT